MCFKTMPLKPLLRRDSKNNANNSLPYLSEVKPRRNYSGANPNTLKSTYRQ